MSDFHIVVIFNDYYTQIIAVFDQTDAEQKSFLPINVSDFHIKFFFTHF